MRIAMFFIAVAMSTFANAQKKVESPAQTVSGKVNEATVTIKYGSPSVKGREIWGGLVPFDKVWRAGANDATTFSTDKEIVVEGSKLPAGDYTFFVIPSKTEVTLVFNKVKSQWGAYKYDEKQDQLRVKVTPQVASSNTEMLTYKIENNQVVLSWSNWNIPVNLK